jgi:hypothetical protein
MRAAKLIIITTRHGTLVDETKKEAAFNDAASPLTHNLQARSEE